MTVTSIDTHISTVKRTGTYTSGWVAHPVHPWFASTRRSLLPILLPVPLGGLTEPLQIQMGTQYLQRSGQYEPKGDFFSKFCVYSCLRSSETQKRKAVKHIVHRVLSIQRSSIEWSSYLMPIRAEDHWYCMKLPKVVHGPINLSFRCSRRNKLR